MLFLCARCICRIHFDTTRIAPRFVLPQSYKNSEFTGPLPRFFLIFVWLQPGILNQRERMLSLRARCRLPQAGKFQMHLVASTLIPHGLLRASCSRNPTKIRNSRGPCPVSSSFLCGFQGRKSVSVQAQMDFRLLKPWYQKNRPS